MTSFGFPQFVYSQLFFTPTLPAVSFSGETVIITGANSGIGRDAAKHFVALGAAKVILAVRKLQKGQDAKNWILESHPSKGDVMEVWELDMASYASVKAFAERLNTLDRVDYLVENAGVSLDKFSTSEGDETSITVNVISTFLLLLLALPILRKSGKKTGKTPTVTLTGSEVYYWSAARAHSENKVLPWFKKESNFAPFENYKDSKLLQVMYMQELAPALSSISKGDVIVNIVNPGLCRSNLGGKDTTPQPFFRTLFLSILSRTSEWGARLVVDAAKKGKVSHGQFLLNEEVKEPSAFVMSDEGKLASRRLWDELNEKLEGVAPGSTKNI